MKKNPDLKTKFEDEPLLEAWSVTLSWNKTWPRVISRAWTYCKPGEKHPQCRHVDDVTLEGEQLNVDGIVYDSPSALKSAHPHIYDSRMCLKRQETIDWIDRLLSGNTDLVLNALYEEGFTSNTNLVESVDDGESPVLHIAEGDWYSKNMRLLVRWADDETQVNFVEPNSGESIGIGETPYGKETMQVYCCRDNAPQYNNKGFTVNGWYDVENIQHVVTLTLPLPPLEPKEEAAAITDYIGSGKVYPFTCIC